MYPSSRIFHFLHGHTKDHTGPAGWLTDPFDAVVANFVVHHMARPETQTKIEETMRDNAQPYMQDGRYTFPHTILFGSALKAWRVPTYNEESPY